MKQNVLLNRTNICFNLQRISMPAIFKTCVKNLLEVIPGEDKHTGGYGKKHYRLYWRRRAKAGEGQQDKDRQRPGQRENRVSRETRFRAVFPTPSPVLLPTSTVAPVPISWTGHWYPAWTKNTDMSSYTTRKKTNHEGAPRNEQWLEYMRNLTHFWRVFLVRG
jgi:hypothetical protein